MTTPEFSRTGAIAVNDPSLTREDRQKLREELSAAEEYGKLSDRAKEKYDEAFAIYLQKFEISE